MSDNPGKLRGALNAQRLLVLPGVYDAISARVCERAGFGGVYMTGAGTAASLGFPDFGLITMTEIVQRAGTIAQSVCIPVIADADTGFGNELNVTRAVREYERAGVAGLHIEDQVFPKRCGHLEGKEVVPLDDYLAHVRAAVAARCNPAFMVIARTDARAVTGFEDAIARANAGLEAGADMAFVEAVETVEEMRAVPKLVKGPCLLNVVRGGKTPDATFSEIEAMGYRVAILPSLLIGAAIDGMASALKVMADAKAPPSSKGAMPVSERFRQAGSDEWTELRTKFRTAR
jgi:2-methylisocitrate lyase-like PEP mutase family enzyme